MGIRRLMAGVAVLAAAWGSVAAAAFSSTSQEVRLEYLQNAVTVVFDAGGETVVSAKPLCDCMKLTVQRSRIVVQVDTSQFDRDIEKQLDVTLQDGSRHRLTVVFRVPPLLVVSSRALSWKLGSEPRPQVLHITVPAGSPVKALLRAELVGDGFDYQPTTLKQGCEYTVTITPKSTARPVLNRLQLITDCEDFRARRVIFLQVKR